MVQIEVRDGKRRIRFDGEVIASVASPPYSPRPLTLTLYAVTDSQQYIFSRTKFSRVFHSTDCPIASRNRLPLGSEVINAPSYDEHFLNIDPRTHFVPCPDCHPSADQDNQWPDYLTRHRFEVPRYESQIHDSAHDLAVSLSPAPRDTYFPNYPPYTATLIDAAVDADPRLDGHFITSLAAPPAASVFPAPRTTGVPTPPSMNGVKHD